MPKPKDKKLEIDLAALPTLSKDQLLEIAKSNGIEVAAEAENEAIIKTITDYVAAFDPKAVGDNGGDPPPATPQQENGEGVVIVSTKRAGKTITAVTGKPITFDKDGKATVHPRDAEYLNTCPGFGK